MTASTSTASSCPRTAAGRPPSPDAQERPPRGGRSARRLPP
ncbi:hypothetical protein ACFPRL_11750 [Pseudoclavibacter helvolus]